MKRDLKYFSRKCAVVSRRQQQLSFVTAVFFKYIFIFFLFYYCFAETFILLVLVACIGLEWKYPEHQSQEKNVMLVNYRTLKKMTSFLFSSDETTIR